MIISFDKWLSAVTMMADDIDLITIDSYLYYHHYHI
jgi:hypothetical protein